MGGAATLIVTPEHESILIDTGWAGFEDRDPERIVHVLKDVAGLDQINHLVTTHWHRDHFGGIEGLSKRVRIGRFWDRGLPDPNAPEGDKARYPDGPAPDDPLGKAYRKIAGENRTTLEAGNTFELPDGVKVVVLASGGKVLDASARYPGGTPAENPLCKDAPADKPEDRSDNARSLAFLFEYGDFTFLDCGDLTWNIERQLVCPRNLIGPVDLYQVTHHGLDSSNHPTLVRTIQPTVAIMNNGPRKGGSPETVQLLKSISSIQASYQLHKNQATGPEENTDPELIANKDPEGGQFIHVHVAPGGKSFTVQIGEDGPSQEFSATKP